MEELADKKIRLNLGAGDTVIDGFTAIDRRFGSEVYPLSQYADNSVEEIRASHILEHFGFEDVPKVLAEWQRVLRPGGRIRIAVPDAEKVLADKRDPKRLLYLMGGQTNADDFHKSAFDADSLEAAMLGAGLSEVKPWHSKNTDCASLPVSLNREGIKPDNQRRTLIKTCALMSVPRVGWTDAYSNIHTALSRLGIPLKMVQGVFWGQCMTRGMEEAIKSDIDWLLTIDYDSMISVSHLNDLIGAFGMTKEADAICAMQSRRDCGFPLVTTVDGTDRIATDGTPVRVNTAHFGLTLFRVDAIAKMKKPWFCERPDSSGEWGDGRVDEDIWFWHQWKEAGNTVYLAPNVRIGHLELMVTGFDSQFNKQVQRLPEWRKENP